MGVTGFDKEIRM